MTLRQRSDVLEGALVQIANGGYPGASFIAAEALRGELPKPDLWHSPIPGPLYWDWRCTVCGEPVDDHPSWWQRWRRSRGK